MTHETQRVGYPESLIITKRSGEKSKSQRAAWDKKAVQVKESLLSIPDELLRKALHVEFFYTLPEATMKAMLGANWERIWRMCPPDPPPTVILGRLQERFPPAENVTRFAPYRQRNATAEPHQAGPDVFPQGAGTRVQAGSGAQSLIPAKRKAEVDVVDLTED